MVAQSCINVAYLFFSALVTLPSDLRLGKPSRSICGFKLVVGIGLFVRRTPDVSPTYKINSKDLERSLYEGGGDIEFWLNLFQL